MNCKIIHAHNHGHKNIGDDAMAQNVFNQLKNEGCVVKTITTYSAPKGQNPENDYCSLSRVVNNYDNILIKIFIVGANQLNLKWLYSIYSLIRLELILMQARLYNKTGLFFGFTKEVKQLIDAIKSSSVYVRSGSGSLNNIWFWSSLMPQYTEVRIAKLFGVKVVFTGQGIGPINGNYRRRILRNFINLCDLVTLRDKQLSKKLVDEISGGVCKHSFSVGDDAAELVLMPVNDILEKIEDRSKLIVCQFRGTDYEKYIDNSTWVQLAKQLDILVRKGYLVVVISFSNGRVNDLKVAKRLEILCEENIVVLENIFEPEQAKWLISKAHMTIGQSYHFGVFSLIENVPFVGFYNNDYYDVKLNGLLDWYGKTHWCVSSDQVDKISNMIEALEKDYLESVSTLRLVNQDLRENLQRSIKEVASMAIT